MLIGDSPAKYVFISIAIWSLRLIAPISILYCLLVASLGFPHPLRWLPLDVWMLGEAIFFLLVYVPLSLQVQKAATHPKPLSKEERMVLIRKCLDHVPDIEVYLSGWFLGSPLADIKRENVREFFAWSFMDEKLEDTNEAEAAELDVFIEQLESRLGRELEDGRGKASSLKVTLDKVPMQHRPLIWYAVSEKTQQSSREKSHSTDYSRSLTWSSGTLSPAFGTVASNFIAYPFFVASRRFHLVRTSS